MAAGAATIGRGAGRISRRLDRLSERKFALLVSIPGLLLLAAIVAPPILSVFGLSLFRIELAKDEFVRFVGLNNYLTRLPHDQEILDAIPRTVVLAALTTAVTLPLALVTALVLNRGFRGSSIFFMAVLLPWAIASVVAGIFWRIIFDTHFGIANGILIGFGLIQDPVNWLQNTGQAVTIAIIAQAWRGVPLLAVLLLAALKTIPGTLYRAAKMDGATSWESFRFITLPAIRPTLIIVGILQVIIGLQVFDLLYTLTNGGPGRSTYVLIYAIFELAFQNLSFGYASTVTVVLFGLIVLFSLLFLLVQVRRRRDRAPAIDEDSEAHQGFTARGSGVVRGRRRTAAVLFCRADHLDHRDEPADRRGPVAYAAAPVGHQPVAGRLHPHHSGRSLARLPRGKPSERRTDNPVRHRAGVSSCVRAGAVPAARQAHRPVDPHLHADGPGDRHGDPGVEDLPDPRPYGHGRRARHR